LAKAAFIMCFLISVCECPGKRSNHVSCERYSRRFEVQNWDSWREKSPHNFSLQNYTESVVALTTGTNSTPK
jgi:hypothetical protein